MKLTKRKIAIIGGGYTGLVAAYELAKKGHSVTIFERSDTVGGLASGFTIAGSNLERAYHHLFKTDTHIINLTKELGIGDKLKWHDSSVAIYYDNELYPFMTPLDLLRFKPLSFINRIRAGATVFYLQKTNNWEQFQKISAYAWMKKWAGDQVTKVIWEPLLRGKFDRYYDQVSMAWLWARIHIRANSKEKGDTGEKLGYFENGFQTFTDALLEQLKNQKVAIKTGVSIEKIDSNSTSPSLTVDGKVQTFDQIIATTPSDVFARLIEGSKHANTAYLEKLRSINYLGALLLIFSSDQDISKYYWHNVNDLDLPFLVFINHTKLIDSSNYNGKHVYYIGAYLPHEHDLFTLDDTQLTQTWFDSLTKIFPDFDRSKIDEKFIFRFKNAQHIVDEGYAEKIPDYVTPLPGVMLANFSQIYPEDRGTNYAVREGQKIAELAEAQATAK